MKKILGIVALGAAVVAAPAHATNGMRMIGFGPVQNSMGGASVAAPLDSATIVSNPAGLAELAPRVDLSAQGFSPTVKYEMKTPGPTLSGTSDRPLDVLPTLAGVYRVQDQITLGFAALGVGGMGVEYKDDGAGNKLMTSYLNGRVAPAVAYKVNDRLAVGAALNLMYAQMKWQMTPPGSPAAAPETDAGSALGFGGTIGVTFKAHEMVTVGAAYETQSFFQDFEWTVEGAKMTFDFDQPQVATLGVAVRPAKGLVLALDGQWINWAAVMGKDLPKVKTPAGDQNFDMGWSDQLVAKLGVEYAIPALEALKVRAGYNYGATPLDEKRAGSNMMFPAVAEHHVTLGAGYDAGKFSVNVAAMYSPEASVKGEVQPGVQLESKMSQLAFELGGAYRF